jgi:iron complex transport system substrate-binding protein
MKYLAIIVACLITLIAVVGIIYSGSMQNEEQKKTYLKLVDDTGYVTNLDAYPEKIISLAPSTTEILFALELDDRVVAVSNYCNYPHDFSVWIAEDRIKSIGDFSNPSMEVITSLQPDLILATAGVQGESITSLRNLGYKVLVLAPANINGILQNIELVGNSTGKISEATVLINNIQNRIDAVVNKVVNAPKLTVYYEVWYDPTSLWTAGARAWQNELIEKAGGENIFVNEQLEYFQSSAEAVIMHNPDIILVPSEGMGFGEPFWGSIETIKARPGWNTISAIINDGIHPVDSDTIARAGPRVADIIEDLAVAFHPELF